MNFKSWFILSETITVKDQEFRDPLNALEHIQATHPNPENLVVTFTAIDKVGINPKSTYSTPFGIYFYPLDYVIHKEMDVEFAGDQHYINVCEFTRPDKILHMTSDINNQKGIVELLYAIPEIGSQKIEMCLYTVNRKYFFRSDYSELWLVTREMAENKPVLWNANLRKCGIDGFVDHGTGTIHINEPTQGVVFTANSLKRILVIPQTLFTKQGESMPVRKPLPDPNKLSVEQLENLLKTRNLSDNDFHYLLAFAPDKDEMAKLIVQHVKELSGDNINSLLGVVSDKDEMARFIIEHIKELSVDIISVLLLTAYDKVEMARILGSNNINKLNGGHVKKLLDDPSNGEMAEILGPDNINKLTGDDVKYVMSSMHGINIEKMARILGPDNINKLSGDHVYNLLLATDDKEKMAKILGSDNINKLTNDNVYKLLFYAPDKNKMRQLLKSYYTETNPRVIYLLNK